jgi:hypothetical protein
MPSESLPFGSLSAHDEDELAHARKLTSNRLKACLARADEFEQRLQYFEAQRRANGLEAKVAAARADLAKLAKSEMDHTLLSLTLDARRLRIAAERRTAAAELAEEERMPTEPVEPSEATTSEATMANWFWAPAARAAIRVDQAIWAVRHGLYIN